MKYRKQEHNKQTEEKQNTKKLKDYNIIIVLELAIILCIIIFLIFCCVFCFVCPQPVFGVLNIANTFGFL
jgi:uncharacterized membrane protein